MKIERIDDKTVKCFLSNEELEEYDIDYKDFVTRSDKAKEVVQEIIEQAEEEATAKDLITKYELFAKDGKGLYALNDELAGRTFTPPEI